MWVGSQHITRLGQTVIEMLMKIQIWHLPSSSVACEGGRDGSEKEQWLLPALPSGRKLLLQFLPLCQTLQFLLVCPGAFGAAPQSRSSEEMHLCKSICNFFKQNYLRLQNPVSHSIVIPLVFIARCYGDFFSWLWNPETQPHFYSWLCLLSLLADLVSYFTGELEFEKY